MSKENKNFFIEKKNWSEVKDELLSCYLEPYIQKIIHTRKTIFYIDCFAGKGKFDDGKPGSPVIALDTINKCKEKSSINPRLIESCFIDINYAKELTNNLSKYENVKIIDGSFEDNIINLLKDKDGSNIFLYIDPYGIKALDSDLFSNFTNENFNSIELLINLNSFGFIRQACNVLGVQYTISATVFDDLVEYEPTKLSPSEESIKELNHIAGGDYWIKIVNDFKANRIDGYEAESLFAENYCNKLRESYRFVLNMPLRIKKGNRPKYRMIHATNHEDGCLLMVDNIHNRWQVLNEIQKSGQLSFLPEDTDNNIIEIENIKSKLSPIINKCLEKTPINTILTKFFMDNGVICSTSDLRKILKQYEKDREILVDRKPSLTEGGKPTAFFSSSKKQEVFIRNSNEHKQVNN